MKKTLKSLLCTVMVIAIVFATVNVSAIRQNSGYSIADNNSSGKPIVSEDTDPHEIVSIIVKLKDKPMLAVTELGTKKAADMRNELIAKQDKVIAEINKSLVKGSGIDVKYHYTALFNGFSFNGEYRLIDEIKSIAGVADCYRSNVYDLPDDIKVDEPTKLATSVGWINADEMWELGYTGQGQTIAIIDTGLKVNHPSFATAPAEPYFDAADIQNILDNAELCAEERYNGTLTGADLYHSAKIPFTFNYYAGNTNVGHSYSGGNDHGTHVTSIAAGNDSNIKGVAYNAQIISMQVFQSGGAAWSEILAALEDCAMLEVDAVNMSLGDDCGFTDGDADMDAAFALLAQHGVNCSVAAGNSTSTGVGNNFGSKQPTFNIDNGVIASPSTLAGALAVAASDNTLAAAPSSFSSWGTTSDLKLKPEIMAPGGNINAATDSTYSDADYGVKNGTSMASPHIVGSMALVNQYVDANFPQLSRIERVEMVNTLLMSTAVPSMVDGTAFSPRQQGAGQANLSAAISTKAYIEVAGSVRPKLEIGDDDNRTGIFTLTFDVVNFGNTPLTYTVNTQVLTEATEDMLFQGETISYMTGISHNITGEVEVSGPDTITVPANGRTTVTVTVDVNDYVDFLNEKFPVGTYIEGFVMLDGAVDLSVPYLGFYGDWEYASVLDREFYYEEYVGSVVDWGSSWGINSAGSTYSGSSYIEFGMNPFTDTTDFLLDRASISPNGDGKMDAIDMAYNYLLRNCDYFEYSIVDAETNEEYYNLQIPRIRKSYEKSWYVEPMPVGITEEQRPNWSGTNLPDGTTVILRMEAVMDSHEEFDAEANENAVWEIPVTIDSQVPEVVYWNMQDGQLTIYVRDNHYTSYVGVYSDSACNNLIAEKAVEEDSRGVLSLLTFDVGNRSSVYVRVGDYAYNAITAQITEGEGGSLEPIELEGISFDQSAIELYESFTTELSIVREPINANNFEVVWSSANESIATVRGNLLEAYVTGVREGSTTVTAVATDKATGESFTATIPVIVNYYPSLNEVLNVEGGDLNFTTTGAYPWDIDLDTFDTRTTSRSTNRGVASSQSTITLQATLSEGDVLAFDWAASCEYNWDKLVFYVNGTAIDEIYGENPIWSRYEYTILADGDYTFAWSYEKDRSMDKGSDNGWIDNVEIIYAGGSVPTANGDVDGDGRVTAEDALITMRTAMRLQNMDADQLAVADVDGDGIVTIVDATLIIRMSMGLLEEF